MTPIHCQQCGRANGPSARRCIWCGVPLVDGGTPAAFDTTRVEIDYLDGIERLDDPGPVRLVIDSDGIEVSELMPGSRKIRIAAESLIGADAIDASTEIEPRPRRRPLWLKLIVPFGLGGRGERPPDPKRHDYMLTVRYKAGDEVRSAVFHRQDRAGLSMVEGLARIINMLVKMRPGGSPIK
jgi:hypothetical protein